MMMLRPGSNDCAGNATSLKDIVNDALRRGLGDSARGSKQKEPFKTQSVDLGRLRLPSIDNISESLAAVEGEGFK